MGHSSGRVLAFPCVSLGPLGLGNGSDRLNNLEIFPASEDQLQTPKNLQNQNGSTEEPAEQRGSSRPHHSVWHGLRPPWSCNWVFVREAEEWGHRLREGPEIAPLPP